MSISVRPGPLVAATIAVAGVASGATILVLRHTTVCEVTVPSPFVPVAPGTSLTDAERDANTRRALAHPGSAARGGARF